MTKQNIIDLQKNLDDGVPFSLYMYFAICGKVGTLELAQQIEDGEIPEPWRSMLFDLLPAHAFHMRKNRRYGVV